MATEPTRRCLLFAAGALAGAGAGAIARGRAAPSLLRPPGALDEDAFLAACIRCGQCVSACPDDALVFAAAGHALASQGTPFVAAARAPCTLCHGRGAPRCIDACPSGALEPVASARAVRMGTAVIDRAACFAHRGVPCRACWHACPFPGEALAWDERLRPVVDRERCVGCGLCEHACLTAPASIAVRPRGAEGA